MISQRKTQIILVLLVSSVFLFQSCATIIRGTSQNIPVTSYPEGAKIIVDGKEMGYAPIELKLKRKKSHLIRIEKQGYNPFEIRVTRKSSSLLSLWGNNFLGGTIGGLLGALLAGASDDEGVALYTGMLIGGIVGWVGAVVLDFSTGANYNLTPDNLILTMTKIEGSAQPNYILIDAEQLQKVKWIRIRCANSDKEEIVNID